MPLGVRRSHRPAAIVACGCAPLARTSQGARTSRTRSPSCRRAPTTRPRRAVAQRRDEAHRREHARAGGDRGAADDLVEALPRQHGEAAGHVDAAAARRDAGERRRRCAPRPSPGVEHAEPVEGAVRVGDEAVAADLVARKRLRVDEDDVAAGTGEHLGGGAPAGPAPTTIASQRSGRRSRSRFMRDEGRFRSRSVAGAGVIRQAATMAQAVMTPTSAKVSWKAASGCGGCAPQPPFEDVADQADADRAAELAQEVDRARAMRDQRVGHAVHRAEVERRHDHAQAEPADRRPGGDERKRGRRPTPSIRKNDAASSTRPTLTIRLTAMRSASGRRSGSSPRARGRPAAAPRRPATAAGAAPPA